MKNRSRKFALIIGIELVTILGLASCTWNEPKREISAENQVNDLGPAPSTLEAVDKNPNSGYIIITSPLNEASFYADDKQPIEFKADVSPNATKIAVKWNGNSSNNANFSDDYVLTAYKPGDATFKYKASIELKNLTQGKNIYVFTAFYEKTGMITSTTHTIYYMP